MILSCCGLDCEKCDAYLATQNNDNELRKITAKKWSAVYSVEIKPEYINCVGCTREGPHVYHCESSCEVRKCVKKRNYANCAECPDYACESLKQIFAFSKEPQKNLEKLRKH